MPVGTYCFLIYVSNVKKENKTGRGIKKTAALVSQPLDRKEFPYFISPFSRSMPCDIISPLGICPFGVSLSTT
jgi:hypothetical protein